MSDRVTVEKQVLDRLCGCLYAHGSDLLEGNYISLDEYTDMVTLAHGVTSVTDAVLTALSKEPTL